MVYSHVSAAKGSICVLKVSKGLGLNGFVPSSQRYWLRWCLVEEVGSFGTFLHNILRSSLSSCIFLLLCCQAMDGSGHQSSHHIKVICHRPRSKAPPHRRPKPATAAAKCTFIWCTSFCGCVAVCVSVCPIRESARKGHRTSWSDRH